MGMEMELNWGNYQCSQNKVAQYTEFGFILYPNSISKVIIKVSNKVAWPMGPEVLRYMLTPSKKDLQQLPEPTGYLQTTTPPKTVT